MFPTRENGRSPFSRAIETGCWIEACVAKDFDSLDIFRDTEKPGVFDVTKGTPVEGQTMVIEYSCPTSVSAVQIARNAEGALRAAGYSLIMSGKVTNNVGSHVPAVVAKKGGQWVQVLTDTGGRAYLMSAVRESEVSQVMTADATAMAASIERTGHVAIYGVTFDSGQSTIKPQSDATLAEMVILLTNNPSWRMRIEGHTDNVGTTGLNTSLSNRRAAAVEAWLVAHGVDGGRLAHQGYGDSRPATRLSTGEPGIVASSWSSSNPAVASKLSSPSVRRPPKPDNHRGPTRYTRGVQFMVLEHFRDPKAVRARFMERGRMLPDGVIYHASWIDPDRGRCYQVMEAETADALTPWLEAWSDLIEFEVISVLTSADYWGTAAD